MRTLFTYCTGEEVRLGDIVRFSVAGEEETVSMIIEPGTQEAEWYLCEETGGVMIEPGMDLLAPDDCSWEDLEFIARGQPPAGAQCPND